MTTLKPEQVFHFFHEICQVPRPSKKEGQIRNYLIAFAQKRQLEYKTDEVGNVCICKKASAGYEDRKKVILQSHMDMVCEKNKGTEHDFSKDPIETFVDGEWLRAKGTTLGADNGIGIATELAILDSKDLEHGDLECVFTVDEETGLTGAFAMKDGFMTGDILLNLDSEDEGEMFIGCAGGCRTSAFFDYQEKSAPKDAFFFRVTVEGLTGGHSGDDINKGRANANKLLCRFLNKEAEKYPLYLSEIKGGNLHNAIPREAYAVGSVPDKDKENIRVDLNVYAAEVEAEYAVTEPNMRFVLESETPAKTVIDKPVSDSFLKAMEGVFNGVYAMSQDIEGLVETSSNLAAIKMVQGKIQIDSSQRSSILSARKDVSDCLKATFELAGATVDVGDGYPGWKPNTHSEILEVALATYRKLFGKEAKAKAIHAGLECGLFLEKNPSLDMISFGPTLRGVHSPDERMLIPTVDMFWCHLLEILKNIPKK